MPTYQYTCTECAEPLERVQSFSDDPLTVCPACGGRLRKVYSAVGIVFKGSGFYRTDSRAGAAKGSGDGKDTAAKDGAGKDGAGRDGARKDGATKDGAAATGGSSSSSSGSGSGSGTGSAATSAGSNGSGATKAPAATR